MHRSKICIVDDNEAVCQSLSFLFTSHFDVVIEMYHNPLVFLDNVSSDWKGCLIIDLFMPFMNGIDVIKELNTRKNTMRIILTSGHADASISTQTLVQELFTFIRKPLNITYLLSVVGEAIKDRRINNIPD